MDGRSVGLLILISVITNGQACPQIKSSSFPRGISLPWTCVTMLEVMWNMQPYDMVRGSSFSVTT